MRPICILLAGEPVAATRARRGDFRVLIRDAIGVGWAGGVCDVDLRTEPELEPERFAALIVTGSASSVTERAPWMLRAESLLRAALAAEVPVFGLCFGHQLLGQALGGRVAPNPRGREMGTVALDVSVSDLLLGAASRRFLVNTTHVDSVVELPPHAVVLASTGLEPNAAIRFGERAWGVQFHPEFDDAVMREYVDARRGILAQEGCDADALLAGAADTPESRELFQRFLELVARN